MRSIRLILLAAAALAPFALTSPADAASRCARIKGQGIGITDSIARWMATKAVKDSAAKWANGGKHSLSKVHLSCSGLSCSGEAKACR